MLFLLSALLCIVGAKAGHVAFSNTLGDHAVLQQPVIVWGNGVPGDTVTINHSTPGASTTTAKVGPDGVWKSQALTGLVESLAPITITATSSSKATAVLHDILIGKTILCSGQSNVDLVSGPSVWWCCRCRSIQCWWCWCWFWWADSQDLPINPPPPRHTPGGSEQSIQRYGRGPGMRCLSARPALPCTAHAGLGRSASGPDRPGTTMGQLPLFLTSTVNHFGSRYDGGARVLLLMCRSKHSAPSHLSIGPQFPTC
jgi:hypothetical protein